MAHIRVYKWVSAEALIKMLSEDRKRVDVFVPIDPSLTDLFNIPWVAISRAKMMELAWGRIDQQADSYGISIEQGVMYVIGLKSEE